MPIRTEEMPVVNHRLTQVGLSFRSSKTCRSAVFICECGNRKVILLSEVSSGGTRSCGCLREEVTSALRTTHGHTKGTKKSDRPSREYRSWNGLKDRCENPNSHKWDDYGGRGITVCDRWSNSFEAFFEDMGPKPVGCSLDRVDNSKGYCKENCRWASIKQQARNTRKNRLIEWDGRTQCLSEWAEELGMKPYVLGLRFKAGWSVERALTTPLQVSKKANP